MKSSNQTERKINIYIIIFICPYGVQSSPVLFTLLYKLSLSHASNSPSLSLRRSLINFRLFLPPHTILPIPLSHISPLSTIRQFRFISFPFAPYFLLPSLNSPSDASLLSLIPLRPSSHILPLSPLPSLDSLPISPAASSSTLSHFYFRSISF